MKLKLLTVICVCLMGMGSITTTRASEDPFIITGDVVLARPGCFVATIFGSAVFVVALPFAAMSGSVKSTADSLVVGPAKATFTRPLGDFSSLQ